MVMVHAYGVGAVGAGIKAFTCFVPGQVKTGK